MKLHEIKFGLAAAISIAILWIICSLIVWLSPGMSMEMSGHMVHSDLSQMQWQLSLSGIIIGLIIWSLFAGIIGWLIATVYNKLTS